MGGKVKVRSELAGSPLRPFSSNPVSLRAATDLSAPESEEIEDN